MTGVPVVTGASVLVTGATGGLGLALVDGLVRAGRRVRATGRSGGGDRRLGAPGVEFVPADLTDPSVAERLSEGQATVFHAAALSASWGLPAAFEAANVTATAHLLAAAQRAGCGRFVHVSSPAIYAALRDRVALTEQDPPNPVPLSHYARTKLAAERLVLRAAQPGFATVAVRPRAIAGPDDRVLLPRFAAIAARGWMPLLRGGRALIEFTDVRDVVAALLLAEDRAAVLSGQAVNVSGGQPVPMREVAGRLAGALGTTLRSVPIPLPAALAAATLAERAARPDGPEPALTRYTLATLAFSQTFDMARARTVLGFVPRHDALETLLQAARGRRA